MRTFIVIILMLFSFPSWSCVCHRLNEGVEFERATGVFFVQITSTEYTEVTEQRAFNYVSAKFRIIETLKGKVGKLQELRSEKNACELPLMAGELYLVFSTGNDYELLSTCTNSRWVKGSQNNNKEWSISFGSNERRLELIK